MLVFSGLLIAACGDQNEGGAGDSRAAANVKQAAGVGTPVSTGPQQIEMGDDTSLGDRTNMVFSGSIATTSFLRGGPRNCGSSARENA